MDPKLSHCFFTLTYHSNDARNANIHIGTFTDKLKKHCKRVYPEIEDRFSYLWVRELTKKEMDHFHMMAVLPVFPIPKKDRKHPAISQSIPWYYRGEKESKFFSLNKAWCASRGYYSTNAVRISEDKKTKAKKFVIDDLEAAMRYVAKYCTKGQKDEEGNQVMSSKPVMHMSRNLTKWTKPLPYDDILDFAFTDYWGDSFKFTDKETGEIRWEKVLKGDFATVGKIQLTKAARLYFDLQHQIVQDKLKALELEALNKKIQLKLEQKRRLERSQLSFSQSKS
jgi:hypothetical protein